MNSDLYFDETASWPAFSSTRRLDCSTSWFFCSASMFCSASSAGLPAEVLVGLAQLLLLRAQLLGLRLGLLEQVLGEGVGLDRVEHEADALGELVEERLVGGAERARTRRARRTARTDPSNRTGRTMMLSGGDSPSPELILT